MLVGVSTLIAFGRKNANGASAPPPPPEVPQNAVMVGDAPLVAENGEFVTYGD